MSAGEIDAIDARVAALLDAAVAFAEESPVPDLSELHDHVFVESR